MMIQMYYVDNRVKLRFVFGYKEIDAHKIIVRSCFGGFCVV